MAANRDEHESPGIFRRLVPILFVDDLWAEVRFYQSLGFEITYQGPEYPDFVALGSGDVEFGLEQRHQFNQAHPAQVLLWQFGVTDVDAASDTCRAAGLDFEMEIHKAGATMRYRTVRLTTPNGYPVLLEGPQE